MLILCGGCDSSDNHGDILALLNWYLWCLFILLQGQSLRNASGESGEEKKSPEEIKITLVTYI